MREIKFRSWGPNTMYMWSWDELKCTVMGWLEHQGEAIIMQYTGLKDKNGVEIWEGDIIKVPDDWDRFGCNAGEIYEVYFDYGGFRLKPKYNPKSKGYWLEDGGMFEIIGNIYENSELISRINSTPGCT